jgi:hypothetical protein
MGCQVGKRACLLRQLSGFESRHLSKIQNGRHKQRSGQHTLARPKNIHKKHKWLDVRRLTSSIISALLANRKGDRQARPTAMLAD